MSDMFSYGFGIRLPNHDNQGSSDAKKNTEKSITITKRELEEIGAEVVSSGKFVKMSMKKDPTMGSIYMMIGSILMAELITALFSEEDEENGKA